MQLRLFQRFSFSKFSLYGFIYSGIFTISVRTLTYSALLALYLLPPPPPPLLFSFLSLFQLSFLSLFLFHILPFLNISSSLSSLPSTFCAHSPVNPFLSALCCFDLPLSLRFVYLTLYFSFSFFSTTFLGQLHFPSSPPHDSPFIIAS